MGGLQVHNHATSWPNLQVRTCKNSIQIEFQVGPECGNIIFGSKLFNKLGLSWAKLSSNWNWNFVLLHLRFVAFNLFDYIN